MVKVYLVSKILFGHESAGRRKVNNRSKHVRVRRTLCNLTCDASTAGNHSQGRHSGRGKIALQRTATEHGKLHAAAKREAGVVPCLIVLSDPIWIVIDEDRRHSEGRNVILRRRKNSELYLLRCSYIQSDVCDQAPEMESH